MFHNLRRFCFNLPNTLRCGHSHWLDLLIQLVFFDDTLPPSPPPSLSSSCLSFPSPALLWLLFTVAWNLWTLLTTVSGGRNQNLVRGVVCTAPDAATCRWPAQCRCSNVARGLMSFITNMTKIGQICFNLTLTHLCFNKLVHFSLEALWPGYANLNWCDCLADLLACQSTTRMTTARTGQTITQTETVDIIKRQTEDLSNQTRWTWEGVGSRFVWKRRGGWVLGGLCHGRGRPMERRGPHAPADHNRGLIMSA